MQIILDPCILFMNVIVVYKKSLKYRRDHAMIDIVHKLPHQKSIHIFKIQHTMLLI